MENFKTSKMLFHDQISYGFRLENTNHIKIDNKKDEVKLLFVIKNVQMIKWHF